MNARDYTNILHSINPVDELEKNTQLFALSCIQNKERLIRISDAPALPNDKHLTCYCAVMDYENSKILLGKHRKAQIWLPPGGHIEDDETPLETAIRECNEELGIPARFIQAKPFFLSSVVTRNTVDPHTDISFWHILISSTDENIPFDKKEFEEVKWFDFDGEFPSEIEPNLNRFIGKHNNYGNGGNTKALAQRLMTPDF